MRSNSFPCHKLGQQTLNFLSRFGLVISWLAQAALSLGSVFWRNCLVAINKIPSRMCPPKFQHPIAALLKNALVTSGNIPRPPSTLRCPSSELQPAVMGCRASPVDIILPRFQLNHVCLELIKVLQEES